MKTILICLLLFTASQYAFGQVTGKLTGGDGKPVPFANMILVEMPDTILVKTASADTSGAFHLDDVSNGKYVLKINAMGYQTWQSEAFELNADARQKDLGVIVLKGASKQLGEVEIRGDKPQVQQ